MNIADEIRQQIEKCRELKLEVGEINNHLSILEGLVRKDIEERVDDAYNKGYAQCQDDYSDALKHAKDTAYKRGFEDGKEVNDKGCVGCKFDGNGKDHSPCDYCCNGYSNQYQAKQTDDEIKVGDEVRRKTAPANERGGIVTKEYENTYYIMWTDGSSGQWDKDRVVKTGRHFDIASILKEMQS